MAQSEREIIESIKVQGVCCLPNFLDEKELEETRRAVELACTDKGHGQHIAGQRTRLSGAFLLTYPAIARVFASRQIKKLCSKITEEPTPFLQEIVTNRYIPEHPGLSAHLDEDFGELVPPFMRLTWALFLDDISAESGALLYAPGTHWNNYISAEDPDKQSPTAAEIRSATYVPIQLSAGTLILRAADVWHAVSPIHHLRRYITGSYSTRTRVSEWLKADIAKQTRDRRAVNVEEIPESLRQNFF